MEILIFKSDCFDKFTGNQIYGDIDDVIKFLRKKINGTEVFTYCWDEDGKCAISNDEESAVERDAERMLSLVRERINKFGYCRFGCKIGEIVVKDYDNAAFIQSVIRENTSRLQRINEKNLTI